MPGQDKHCEFTSSSPEQTTELGCRIGRSLVGGMTMALDGPLGAGKTQLVKGVAAANGHTEPNRVTSPTFTLIQEYTGRFTLYHLDAYRLRGSTELLALGFEELVRPDSVVIMEWADRVSGALPEDRLQVTLGAGPGTQRKFRFTAQGSTARAFLERFNSGSG
jgi:tRNA threonylcarbamoyladenosine biosynthesis protein TsaE